MDVSAWITRQWDAVEGFIGHHRRKALVAGFFCVFLPQWWPSAREAIQWVWSYVPGTSGWRGLQMSLPDFSPWNWITAPIGIVILFLAWRQSRRAGPGQIFATGGKWEQQFAPQEAINEQVNSSVRVQEERIVQAELERCKSDLQTALNERAGAIQAFETCKKHFALARLGWIAERSRLNNWQVRVTIRSTGYEDFDIVEHIEKLLKEHTQWPVTIDTSNAPLLRPDERFKVVFVSNIAGPYEYLSGVFEEGRLLNCPIGVRKIADTDDVGHILIEVLPTAAPKQTTSHVVTHDPSNLTVNDLVIHKAVYGFRDSSNDVAHIIRERIVGNRVDLLVTNETMEGDPCEGHDKALSVDYSIRGGPRRSVVKKEHERLQLPETSPT